MSFRRKIAAALSAVLLISSVPFSSFADPAEVFEEADYMSVPDVYAEEITEVCEVTENEGRITPETAVSAEILGDTEEMAQDAIAALLKAGIAAIAEGAMGEIGEWGTEKILNVIFPGMSDMDEVRNMLNEVLKNQNAMMADLNRIKTNISQSEYDAVLNNYLTLKGETVYVSNAYGTLKDIDDKLAEKTITEEEAAAERKAAVTTGIGITNMQSAAEGIDNYCEAMYTLISTSYNTTLPDGRSFVDDLLGIQYQQCRNIPDFLFENQAYDILLAFQNYVIGNYMLATAVELLSLNARIAVCKEHNADPNCTEKWYTDNLERRIKDIKEELEGSDSVTGIQQVMKKHEVVKHDDYRYFWVPGYEMKFYTVVESKLRPRETFWSDIYRDFDLGWDFEKSEGFTNRKLVENFWAPFWKNSVAPGSNLATYAEYDRLLAGAKKQTSKDMTVYEILFGEKAGACIKAGDYAIDENTSYICARDDTAGPFYTKITGGSYYGKAYHMYGLAVKNTTSAAAGKAVIDFGYYSQDPDVIFLIRFDKHGHAWQDRNNQEQVYAALAMYDSKISEPYKMIIEDTSIEEDDPTESGDEDSHTVAADTWAQDPKGWKYFISGRPVASQWAELTWNGRTDWYRFGDDGYMITGFFTDKDGRTYYLNPVSDGTMGSMFTGWHFIDGTWYLFSTEKGSGHMGALLETSAAAPGEKSENAL